MKPTQIMIGPLIRRDSANRYYVFKKKKMKFMTWKAVRTQIHCLGIFKKDKELLLQNTPI